MYIYIYIYMREIYSFVLLCFLYFCFNFRDLNKQDCDRRCLEKDSFHFIIFTFVLKASPFSAQLSLMSQCSSEFIISV